MSVDGLPRHPDGQRAAWADDLELGRAAFAANSWADAFTFLAAADEASPLGPDDLETLASAAYLTGRHDLCTDAWARAHRAFATQGDDERAAGCALWLAFTLVNRGEFARAAGWVGRAVELLEGGTRDCAQRGFLLALTAVQSLMQGDAEHALPTILDAVAVADRFDDDDLKVLSRLGHGQILLELGRTDEGIALLDGVMVAVTTGEASATVAGLAYCAVISACQDIFDIARAQQWTAALTHWCDAQQGLVPYSGQCLVHRAEIMALRGAWPDADEATHAALDRFELAADEVSAGAAYYVAADVHRFRGDFARADESYREASRRGRDPQPGLALLRLAQGQPDTAAAIITRVADETQDRSRRPRVLAAHVEIMLAVREVAAARAASDELTTVARAYGAELLLATAAQCDGAVLLAEGDFRSALTELRRAWTGWQQLGAPHEAARSRVLVGLACRGLGDEDSAQMELDAARWAFGQLGAVPDLARVDALVDPAAPAPDCGLTAREVEVLRLVATGRTNRAIAADLVLSEKTVARHLSNIFTKLGLSSRAAATAYAYERHLL